MGWNCSSNLNAHLSAIQTDKILKEHELLCKDHDHCDILLLEKFITVLNKGTCSEEEVAGNILKQRPRNKSLYEPVFVYNDFETIIV